jgi:hypothetical protein
MLEYLGILEREEFKKSSVCDGSGRLRKKRKRRKE